MITLDGITWRHNFNGDLAKPSLKLENGWVIVSNHFITPPSHTLQLICPSKRYLGRLVLHDPLDQCTGNFSIAGAHFLFERRIGYFLIRVYGPSILHVMLSWVSFWLSPDAVPGRVSLGIVPVFSLANEVRYTDGMFPTRVGCDLKTDQIESFMRLPGFVDSASFDPHVRLLKLFTWMLYTL